jgi:predicted deacetylase
MNLSFRIDDVTPTMDWPAFYATIDMLSKFNIKPILGVIPNCQAEELLHFAENNNFWTEIKQMQDDGYPIAMHGYDHIYISKSRGVFPVNNFSEFAEVPYEVQRQKIQKGVKILRDHGLNFNIFMAPGHSFDNNTCKILLDNDINYMTDGFGSNIFECNEMRFLPVILTWRRVYQLRKWKYGTLVLHTNIMSKDLLDRYRDICNSFSKNLFNYSEDFLNSLTEVKRFDKEEMDKEFKAYDRVGKLSSLYHRIFKK